MDILGRIYTTSLWNRFGKNSRELDYWRKNIDSMIDWYRGKKEWRFAFPAEHEKEFRYDLRKNAIMTYVKRETTAATYLSDLRLASSSFAGMRVADIGSGPFPTLLVFENCERYCLDHLIDDYRKLGYPLDEYESEVTFVNCKSEAMPFDDDFFDVVLSRNALDHVDDFDATSKEIKRVLRPDGVLCILVNCHKPTKTETQSLSDDIIQRAFGELGVQKVTETQGAWGFTDGKTVLWSNMKS
jgi:SAM-dependent methyltransferase